MTVKKRAGDALDELHAKLSSLAPGPIPTELQGEVLNLLAECWHEFEGSDQEAMAAHKLDRAGDLRWEAPVLSFIIERHGGTVLGSTRAELQRWIVNLENKTADFERAGYRQLTARAPAWKAEPAAEEIASLIRARRQDRRLKWLNSHRVQIKTPEIIPDYHDGPKRTIEGRRKRFYTTLDRLLERDGWKRRGNVFHRH